MSYYLKQLVYWPIYLTSSIVPKKDNIWVFSAWIGKNYSDNPKYLYEYVINNQPNIQAYWITSNPSVYKKLNSQGMPCLYTYSLSGFLTQMRAGVAIFSHSQSSDFMPAIINGKTKTIQLWHGTPLKKIGAHVKNNFKTKHPILSKFRDIIYPWMFKENYDLIISASSEVSSKLVDAFKSKKVVITGYPRNDALKVGSTQDGRQVLKKIIYMPTFRGKVTSETANTSTSNVIVDNLIKESEAVGSWFSTKNIKLVLKLHPSNYPTPELIEKIKSFDWLEIYSGPDDIYQDISNFDLLITDYSSIFFDYLLTGKPIIHAAFDLDEYLEKSRDTYYKYEDIALTPEISSWKDITSFIDEALNSGLSKKYISDYEALTNRFNYHKDANSAARVYSEITKLN